VRWAASALMQDYAPGEILAGPYEVAFDEGAIKEYLSYLVPERLQLNVVSKAFEAHAKGWSKEKWCVLFQ
jgi:hypothetical protein